MKKLTLLSATVAMCFDAGAQTGTPFNVHLSDAAPLCGFDHVLSTAGTTYPTLLEQYRNRSESRSAAKTAEDVVYDIPVVFHIVYPTTHENWNIADSIVNDQLQTLNEAFGKLNADTADAREVFHPFIGNAQVKFHLATSDPAGAPTTGITRTVSPRLYFGDETYSLDSLERIKHTDLGGTDGWAPEHYLNIWIGNLSGPTGAAGILGYGIPPLDPLPDTWAPAAGPALSGLYDGVVLQSHVVGSNSPLNAVFMGTYTKGRTAVHEVGHYLGLQHVFGSNGAFGGSCGAIASDGLDDTPEQSSASMDGASTTSCPSAVKNTCGGGTIGDLPDMWENYMDYARDACQVMFTHDQVAVMRAVLGDQRLPLTSPLAINSIVPAASLRLYPNPATNAVTVDTDSKILRAEVIDYLGRTVKSFEASATAAKSYDVSDLPPGNYILSIQTATNKVAGKITIVR